MEMNKVQNPSEKSLPEREADVLAFWEKNNIFQKVVEARLNGEPFVFYDGPPFATGLPHYGHILQMSNKDAVLRYKTMRGFNVPRKIGWDTHGLPVEYELEKELGISGKRQIEEYGIEKFVQAARSVVLRYTKEWESTMARMGRWMDLSLPYATMDNPYIESVWWAFNELYKKGLVYKDYRVSPYCPRCGTVLSNFELNQGYKDDVPDASVYVSLKIKEGEFQGAYLVFWTTTPWTIPAVVAMAVDPDSSYALIEQDNKRYIMAESLVPTLFTNYQIIKKFPGRELIGVHYEPLYTVGQGENLHRVVEGEHVTIDEGTGIASIAPAYGEIDSQVGAKEGLPMVQTVEPDGTIKSDLPLPGAGKFVKKADDDVIGDLEHRGYLIAKREIKHTYPFCWRCNTPLLYYPTTSWFVRVTELKDSLVSENKLIAWQPAHLREGRFGKWLEGARDWAISRNRFWGAPLPIWECTDCDAVKLIASGQELDLDGDGKPDIEDFHRPYIDQIKFQCPECHKGYMQRVPFVFDCWFESGSMPFAQHHYPFENENLFNPEQSKGYPADFIAEALDQTRGWFYTLHVLGVALFGKRSYESVVVTGLLLASDGKKLSKSMRNYTAPEVLFETLGVDPFRLFLFTATALGEDYRFSDNAIADVKRRWITPLINVVTYYSLSLAERDESIATEPHHNLLDQWIKSRVAQAWGEVELAMEGDEGRSPFDLVRACRTFGPLIEDLSTWYVRLSRGRKDAQFTDTLRAVLTKIFELYAPFLPFLTESLYQSVKKEGDEESIHLHLATIEPSWQSTDVIEQMERVRAVVSAGRELRAKIGIPNRQPLAKLEIKANITQNEALDLIRDELQVEKVEVQKESFSTSFTQSDSIALDTTLTSALKLKGNANLIRRTIQDLRKRELLEPSDRAKALLTGDISAELIQEVSRQLPHTQIELVETTGDNAIEINLDHTKLRVSLTKPS